MSHHQRVGHHAASSSVAAPFDQAAVRLSERMAAAEARHAALRAALKEARIDARATAQTLGAPMAVVETKKKHHHKTVHEAKQCNSITGTFDPTPGSLALTGQLHGCPRIYTGGEGKISVSGGSGTISWSNGQSTSGTMVLTLSSKNGCTTGTEYELVAKGLSGSGTYSDNIRGGFRNYLCVAPATHTKKMLVTALTTPFKL